MLVVSCLAKDESARYWRSALAQWSRFADKILVLDDNSSDSTPIIAEEMGAHVRARESEENAWGAESHARAEQWEMALDYTSPGDLIFILDADMVPARDPRDLIVEGADTYFFALYDLWSPTHYRSDFWWRAHLNPRPWLVKRPPNSFEAEWPARGIHTGHLPSNWTPQHSIIAPSSHALLHTAYMDERDRQAKWSSYLKVGAQLNPQEFTHAQSILDPSPALEALRFVPQYTLTRAT